MHIWETSPGLTFYFVFFSFLSSLSLPFSFTFPQLFLSFHSLCFCHPWARIIEEYTPLIALCHVLPDWSQSFSVLLHCLLVHFPLSFPLIFSFAPSFSFVLFFSFPFLSPSFPFHSLIFFPAPKIIWFLSSSTLGGNYYTPLDQFPSRSSSVTIAL